MDSLNFTDNGSFHLVRRFVFPKKSISVLHAFPFRINSSSFIQGATLSIFAISVPDPHFPSVVPELKKKRSCVLVRKILDGYICDSLRGLFSKRTW